MTVTVRSFAKINVGLYIGSRRADGFHDLRTMYQTIALHDVIRVTVANGGGIEIHCDDPRVPPDSSNTCYRITECVMKTLGAQGKVTIEIEKRLPVQGGLGAASSNAVATMLALEKALKKRLNEREQLRIAANVGSDLPLFLIGGTVLGVSHGEEVYPLPDLPPLPMVAVTPEIGVSTAKAFVDWDALPSHHAQSGLPPHHAKSDRSADPGLDGGPGYSSGSDQLTRSAASDRLFEVGCALSAWLRGYFHAGAPARAGGRAGSLLSDLVRAGIENDFEKVVFSQFPELRDMKRVLERAGSRYASLSGSGSTLYGLFASADVAAKAAKRLQKQGLRAIATRTLTRREYWERSLVVGR